MRVRQFTRDAASVLILGGVTPVPAQIPEGFEIVVLADDLGIHSRPEVHNRSEVVRASSFPKKVSDVWLYSDNAARRISEPESYDIRPSINDLSVVAWRLCESYYAQDCQLAIYETDQTTVVETPFSLDATPNISDAHQVIWGHDFSEAFHNVDSLVKTSGVFGLAVRRVRVILG